MSYQSILQVTARNYASDILVGAPTRAMFKPSNGQFAYTYVYPQRNRPKIGIVYMPGVEGEVYWASQNYDWVGVKIGNQYGWVHLKDAMIENIAVPVPEPDPVLEYLAEAVSEETQEVVAEAWDNITAQEAEDPEPPKRKYNKSK